ncbi:MAG: phospholipid carrier-dependent glycosyltransferase [Sphingomonas sp.]|nr:phospholipid carrier-dependent glycosyltransferase [Sphingomonas sp.]
MTAWLKSLSTRPVTVALLIGLAAELLFAVRIGWPTHLFFDEVHYVPAAQNLLDLSEPRNIEHPLLGKELIALGMAIFGDDPYGWRLVPSLFGSATVVAGFAFVWLLTRRMRPAVIAALLLVLNQLLFIQARIAMLDVFLVAFLCWAMVLLLRAMHGPAKQVLWRWIAGSALLGLAVAVKWAAVPYVAFAGMAFIVLRIGEHWEVSPRGFGDSFAKALGAALAAKDHRRWPGLPTIRALLIMAAVSIPLYFLTFLPAFFYERDPMTLARLIPFQGEMYALQTQVLAHHTYQSDWWSWPLMIRPIWYFYELDDGAQRGVLLIGNPAIMWGGLVAVLACFWAGLRDGAAKPLAMALLWTASVAIFIVIPKSLGFYYYYYPSAIFLCFALALAFDHYEAGHRRYWAEWFLAVSFLLFLYFYPILSSMPLSDTMAFEKWTWFNSWR